MYLSGVVISDLDDDENVVIASADYEQVYLPQQYGNDGVLDGAEGFGVMQARALKAKLTRGRAGRRRLAGHRGLLFVGGSPSGLGVAPGVVLAAGSTAKRIFKKPSPRYKGGPLMSTVVGKQRQVESGSLSVVQELERLRRGVGTDKKGRPAWASVWTDLLPTWRYNAQQYAFIRQHDPAFRGPTPAPVGTYQPTAPVASGVPAPAPGSPVDATGYPAPVVISQTPVPSPIPGGAAPTASEQVAAASQEEVGVQQAGMFGGGLDLKNPMTMMMLAGAGLFIISQLGGGGKRRRR